VAHLALAAAVLAAVSRPAPAAGIDRVALVTEFVTDANSPPGREDFYVDPIFVAVRGRAHAALDIGTFARGLEMGWTERDGRRSSYDAFVRRRQGGAIDDTAFEMATHQVLRGRMVGVAALRLQWPDRPEDNNLYFVPSFGAEMYTSGYSYASLHVIVDPRPTAGLTFMLAHRLATESSYFEVMAIPRTDGVLNFAIRGRYRWCVAGYAREHDFDYSRIDRQVWSLGIQYDLGS
jgi:hypothetical protein